jgi:hypothetical protein
MGTWGSGNFQNDAALDYMGDLSDEFSQRIEDIFADEERAYLDEDAEGQLIPTVAILATLAEHCALVPPRPQIVTGWQEKYLALFDDQIDGMEPAEGYAAERRSVIVETFTRLEELSRNFWRDTEDS